MLLITRIRTHEGEALCVVGAEFEFLHRTHQDFITDSVPFFKIAPEHTSVPSELHQLEKPPLLLTSYWPFKA